MAWTLTLSDDSEVVVQGDRAARDARVRVLHLVPGGPRVVAIDADEDALASEADRHAAEKARLLGARNG